MNSYVSHEIRKRLALKHNLPLSEIQLIIKSVYGLLYKTITEGNKETLEFKNIHIPNFGIFKVKEGRKRHFKEIYDKSKIEKDHKD